MLTTKEQLERATKAKSILNAIAFGSCASIVSSAFLEGSSLFRFGALGVNLSCNGAVHYLNRQIKNYDENGYITELNRIYDELLNDTVKLSKNMDNKELLEHYYLLRTMFYLGCFNVNSSKVDFNLVRDEMRLMGALSINNHGVCRHTSSMTIDYMKKLGYKSQMMVGTTGFDDDRIISLLRGYIALDPNGDLSFLDKKEIAERMKEDFGTNKNTINEEKRELSELESLVGNHAIVKANDKDKSYYLDMSLNHFYIPDEDGVLVSPSGDIFTPAAVSDFISKKLFGIKPVITNKKADFFAYLEGFAHAEMKLENNMDMLDQFKKDNQDKLERAEEIYQLKRVK